MMTKNPCQESFSWINSSLYAPVTIKKLAEIMPHILHLLRVKQKGSFNEITKDQVQRKSKGTGTR